MSGAPPPSPDLQSAAPLEYLPSRLVTTGVSCVVNSPPPAPPRRPPSRRQNGASLLSLSESSSHSNLAEENAKLRLMVGSSFIEDPILENPSTFVCLVVVS